MRLIRAENDIDELRAELKAVRETLSDATDFGEELTSQSAEIVNLALTVDSFNSQLRQLFDNTRFLNSDDAKVWLAEMDTICRQAKDSVDSMQAWQNQMSRDFSNSLNTIHLLMDEVNDIKRDRLKLAAIADDRIRDLERALAEATEHSRGVVSRMEQLETRLKVLEASQVRVTLSPNRTVHIPEAIHLGGPISVKMEPPAKRQMDPRQIQCRPLLDDEALDN